MTVAELNAELERILNRLKKDPSVRKVLLFGSLAEAMPAITAIST
jgi:predicted nucleotidyltransferase